MASKKLVKVKGRIIKILDDRQLVVYIDEARPAMRILLSGKQRMVFHKHIKVGNELVFELQPNDPTKGRLARRALNLMDL